MTIFKNILFLISFTLLSNVSLTQNFLNSDLNGIIGLSTLPTFWQSVPASDPNCLASNLGVTDTPDLLDITGPNAAAGLNGNAFVSSTFISGNHAHYSGFIAQEGIMQTVSGFTIGNTYELHFHQTIVKQQNGIDESGTWAVYIDNTLLGISAPSTSTLSYNSNSLVWDSRTEIFIATSVTHTFKFLPLDDDNDHNISPSNTNGALRMGIDNIFLTNTCNQFVNLGNDTTLCSGDSLLLDATTADATYLWNDNSTDSILAISQAGNYWVEVTTMCNVSYDTITVAIYTPSQINLGNDTAVCPNPFFLLNANLTNATYLWSDNSTNSSFVVTQAGTYWVNATTSCAVYSDTITISNSNIPNLSLGNDTTLCLGDFLLLDATTLDATYLWNDNSTDSTLTVSQAGDYWVEINTSCFLGYDTISIIIDTTNQIDFGNDTILCPNDSLILNINLTDADYLWQDNSTDSTFTITQTGLYWLTATTNCSVFNDSMFVSYNTIPSFDIGNDTTLCSGETLLLHIDIPNATYLWQDNTTDSTLNINQIGKYWVEVTTDCSIQYDTINVIIEPSLQLDLGKDTTLCSGESLTLDVTIQNANYLWQDSSTNSTLVINQQNLYWVKMSTSCEVLNDSINVLIDSAYTQIQIGNDTTLCQNESIVLDATTQNATYLWQNLSTNSTLEIFNQGKYWVEVTTNCSTTNDTINIGVQNCNCTVKFPTGFSPNNDGKNDNFSPKTSCSIDKEQLSVYNRWGEQIFVSDKNISYWDGTIKNVDAPIGIYIYIFSYLDENGDKIKINGSTTLIR